MPLAQSGQPPKGGGRTDPSFRVTWMRLPAHSSSGLGRRPLTAVARVRIPYAPLLLAAVNRGRKRSRTASIAVVAGGSQVDLRLSTNIPNNPGDRTLAQEMVGERRNAKRLPS